MARIELWKWGSTRILVIFSRIFTHGRKIRKMLMLAASNYRTNTSRVICCLRMTANKGKGFQSLSTMWNLTREICGSWITPPASHNQQGLHFFKCRFTHLAPSFFLLEGMFMSSFHKQRHIEPLVLGNKRRAEFRERSAAAASKHLSSSSMQGHRGEPFQRA